jgi:hypothetical protein
MRKKEVELNDGCSVCLGIKYFMENILCIFWCLMQSKMMINIIFFLFQFDRRSLFNFGIIVSLVTGICHNYKSLSIV